MVNVVVWTGVFAPPLYQIYKASNRRGREQLRCKHHLQMLHVAFETILFGATIL